MAFKDKKQLLGNRFSEYCRLCTLKALDDGWIEEVDYLQQLQAAISGRSTAQRNLYMNTKGRQDFLLEIWKNR